MKSASTPWSADGALADAAAGAERLPPPPREYRGALLGLIVLAAVLRFAFLDRPCLWYDEAATFGRVNGSWPQMLEVLKNDGFPPLHYELYWLIGKAAFLTPRVMRLVPALAGVFMVPAMYFLARQLASARVALMVAAFAACSAYLAQHARDAKMYMHFWLFVTLHAAFLLLFLRHPRRKWWLAWFATGLAAMGLHAAGLALLFLSPLLALACKPWRWRVLVPLAIGLPLMAAAPLYYYREFNEWSRRSGGIAPGLVEPGGAIRGKWSDSGLEWVDQFNKGQTAGQLVLATSTAYLFGWQWDRDAADPPDDSRPAPWTRTPLSAAMGVVGVAMLLGLLRPPAHRLRAGPATPSPSSLTLLDEPPWWRRAWCLTVWMVVPTYGLFYCRSTPHFVSPLAWLTAAWELLGCGWIGTAAAAAALAAIMAWRGTAATPALAGAGLLGLASLSMAVLQAGAEWFTRWLVMLQAQWLLATVAALLVSASWHCSGPTLRARMVRAGQLLAVVAATLVVCGVFYMVWRHLLTRARANDAAFTWRSIWMPRYLAVVWPAVAVTAGVLLCRTPGRYFRRVAVGFLLAANLLQTTVSLAVDTQPPMDQLAADADAARDPDSATRTFLMLSPGQPTRTLPWLDQLPLRYYLCVRNRLRPAPRDFTSDKFDGPFRLRAARPKTIARELREAPGVRRLIVWDRPDQRGTAVCGRTVLDAAGPGWTPAEERSWQRRQSTTWRDGMLLRRRVFVRVQAPTTQPVQVPPLSDLALVAALHNVDH